MIFDAIANMVSNDQNIDLAVYENRKNRQFQDKQNEKARNFEYQMWLLNNQYNTPAAQMQRYRDAHLNPFLADQTKIGSGNSEGVPSAPMSASGSAAIPTKVPISGIDSPFNYALEQMKVNADVSNQQAQTFNTYMDAALKAYSDGKSELGDKIIDLGFALFGDINKENSYIKDKARLQIRSQELNNQYQSIVNDIEGSIGKDKASAALRKLKAEYDNIAEHTNLYKILETLNDANVRLVRARTDRERSEIRTNIARCKALLSDAALKFSQSEYFSELGLTQSITNRYFDSMTKHKALMLEMDYEEAHADFIGNEYVRELKKSGLYKGQNVFNMQMEQNPVLRTLDQITDIILPFKLKKPDLPAKYRRYGHMSNGDKLVKEWYEY